MNIFARIWKWVCGLFSSPEYPVIETPVTPPPSPSTHYSSVKWTSKTVVYGLDDDMNQVKTHTIMSGKLPSELAKEEKSAAGTDTGRVSNNWEPKNSDAWARPDLVPSPVAEERSKTGRKIRKDKGIPRKPRK